jgi:aryl-alcohol dehydrogenase-like predicted oxidoreductase
VSEVQTPAVETVALRSGYVVSRLIKGGWQLAGGHGEVDAQAAQADMQAYLRAGITAFDCADIYTGVEELIGSFRRTLQARGEQVALDALKVHTKFVPDLEALASISRADVRRIIARSCARLNMRRLDLVQFHWWDFAVPRYREVASWLAELQAEDTIDLLGGTNFDASHAAELIDAGIDLCTMQVQYSVLDARPEGALTALCDRTNLQLLCYGTVAGGFLAERWLGAKQPTGQLENRSLTKYQLIIDDIGGWDLLQAILTTLHRVAARHATDIASVATRWVLDRPHVAAAIVGVRNRAHLRAQEKLASLRLTEADRQEIDGILAQRRPLQGDVYELERDRSGRHGRIMKYHLNS